MKKKEQVDIVPDTVHADQTREKRSITTIVKVSLFDALIAGFLSLRRFLNLTLGHVSSGCPSRGELEHRETWLES